MVRIEVAEGGPTQPFETFKRAVDGGVDYALRLIKNAYEFDTSNIGNRHQHDYLLYHGVGHTEVGIRRTETILRYIQAADPKLVDKRTIHLGRLGFAFHDVDQGWYVEQVEEEGHAIRTRKRATYYNEENSIDAAVAYMDTTNERSETEIFTKWDKLTVRAGIHATVPRYDPYIQRLIQPNFRPLFVRPDYAVPAIALADLGTAGFVDPHKPPERPPGKAFVREAFAEFYEVQLSFAEYLSGVSHGVTRRDPKLESIFYRKLCSWFEGEKKFIEDRQTQLPLDIAWMDSAAKDAIMKLFPASKFAESRQAISLVCEDLQARPEFEDWKDYLRKIINPEGKKTDSPYYTKWWEL